jgi:hypothetical protein
VKANERVLWPVREVEARRAGVVLRIAVEVRLVDVVDRIDAIVDRLKERNPVRIARGSKSFRSGVTPASLSLANA